MSAEVCREVMCSYLETGQRWCPCKVVGMAGCGGCKLAFTRDNESRQLRLGLAQVVVED